MGVEYYLIEHNASISLESKAFPDGGFYVMRHEDLYMIVDCVPNNPKAPSGHRHNSRLSFELSAYGKTFIVDPGSYIYSADPEWRNKFRSTAYHNTVVVDGEEQNEFDAYNLFAMKMNAEVKINEWKVTDESDFLDAQHSGYERLAEPIIHQRQILFNKRDKYWIIRDALLKSSNSESKHRISDLKHHFYLYFHFAPMEIVTEPEHSLLVKSNAADGINIIVIPVKVDGLNLSVEDGWISYSYGTKVEVPVVRYSKSANAPVNFVTILYPYEGLQPPYSLKIIQENALIFMREKLQETTASHPMNIE